MSDLVSDNYRILLLMSRFGIGLGFGESSIGEVCRANGVDTSTFLIVTNMMLYDEIPADAYDKVSMEGLLSYLHNSHDYFLGFRLPAIREKLAAAVGTGSDLSRAIMKYSTTIRPVSIPTWPTKRRWCSPTYAPCWRGAASRITASTSSAGTTTRWRRCSRSSRTY